MRIRIKQKALETYTGQLGMIEFKNGLSVESVSIQEAMRMGASMPIEDEDGNEISPVTYYSRKAQEKRDVKAAEAAAQAEKDAEDGNGENGGEDNGENGGEGSEPDGSENSDDSDEPEDGEEPEEPSNQNSSESGEGDKVDPTDDEDPESKEDSEDNDESEDGSGSENKSEKLYSVEFLEGVADEHGIKGLREIGEKHDIGAKSIEGMIEKLSKL